MYEYLCSLYNDEKMRFEICAQSPAIRAWISQLLPRLNPKPRLSPKPRPDQTTAYGRWIPQLLPSVLPFDYSTAASLFNLRLIVVTVDGLPADAVNRQKSVSKASVKRQ